MKFETTDSFLGDFARLSREERRMFKAKIPAFNEACERWHAERTPFPATLRVKPVTDAEAIWEMSWSYSGPDGRATFQWVTLTDGSVAVRWRRIGGHAIFRSP